MPIAFPDNIKLNKKVPLDSRQVVDNEAGRLGITYVYPGLTVYQKDNGILYICKSETNTAAAWEKVDSDIFIRGYLFNGEFYTDSTYTTAIQHDSQKVYINLNGSTYEFYHYETGVGYVSSTPQATAERLGTVKLYSTNGSNTDGTMTQKSISDGITAIKFNTEDIGDIDGDGETDYMLVLDKPWN